MTTNTTEFRLLNVLRSPQYSHLTLAIPSALFHDTKPLFDAYQLAVRKYGNLSSGAIEEFYREELPPQLDIPLRDVDPLPIIEDLKRIARKRLYAELAQEFAQKAKEFDPSLQDVRERVAELDRSITFDSSVIPGVSQFLSDLRAKSNGTYRWLHTGNTFLDKLIGGEWPRGEVTILTGKSGGGKTATMGSSALNMAQLYHLEQKSAPPTIFSMEMPKYQLIGRMVADLTGIDAKVLRYGKYMNGAPFSAEDEEKINTAIALIESLPLYIVDEERLSAEQVIAAAKYNYVKFGSECFFIDYLQLMSYDLDKGKHYGLGDGVKQLKAFAKEYNIAIVILAQYHEQKETIRDTTDPEKDAGLWIHIKIDFDTMDDNGICIANVELWKNRHGPLGTHAVYYDSRHMRFLGNSHD
jgi:replicative DNA helicase